MFVEQPLALPGSANNTLHKLKELHLPDTSQDFALEPEMFFLDPVSKQTFNRVFIKNSSSRSSPVFLMNSKAGYRQGEWCWQETWLFRR